MDYANVAVYEDVSANMSSVRNGHNDVPSTTATAIGSVVMLAFFIEGLLGTVLIMVALLGKTDLRKSVVNVFIISLCVNDLCTLLLVVDLIIDSYVWQQWRAGDILCRLNPELTVAFTGCSLWHTALIAVHRYIVVVHPAAYKRLSKRAYTVFVLVAARVIPFACCLPGLAHLNPGASGTWQFPIGYVPKLLRCVLPSDDRRRIMMVTSVLTIAPCVIVVLCYTAVLVFVAAAACRVNNTTMRRELHISAIFGAIFLVVLGGFTPYTVVRSLDRNYHFDADVYVAVSVFYGVATCSSPIVYGALSTQIRQACIEVVCDLAAFIRRHRSPCCRLESDVGIGGGRQLEPSLVKVRPGRSAAAAVEHDGDDSPMIGFETTAVELIHVISNVDGNGEVVVSVASKTNENVVLL